MFVLPVLEITTARINFDVSAGTFNRECLAVAVKYPVNQEDKFDVEWALCSEEKRLKPLDEKKPLGPSQAD
ncbi:hypothetical protein [Aeromonas tecta]|uniref:hypothetical protein n=1 Tax=Aeromonas tecta TaxID=324617 RepID=UPI0012F97BFC|nr:hypothetical protein [Aeromonas tecta]